MTDDDVLCRVLANRCILGGLVPRYYSLAQRAVVTSRRLAELGATPRVQLQGLVRDGPCSGQAWGAICRRHWLDVRLDPHVSVVAREVEHAECQTLLRRCPPPEGPALELIGQTLLPDDAERLFRQRLATLRTLVGLAQAAHG